MAGQISSYIDAYARRLYGANLDAMRDMRGNELGDFVKETLAVIGATSREVERVTLTIRRLLRNDARPSTGGRPDELRPSRLEGVECR